MSKLAYLKSKAASVTSGVAFIGGINCNFQLIIKCPVHVYSVIKKNMQGTLSDPDTRFYSGSVPIDSLALPVFQGVFVYRNLKGEEKKYKAAFVFPLDLNREITQEEYKFLHTVCAFLKLANYEFFDKNNRRFETIINTFSQSLLSD